MVDDSMNSKDLISFLQICKVKSITKAAKLLFITPQGLSKIVKNLEAELNVPLFYRQSTGIKLTEYGKVLEHRASHIAACLDGVQTEFNRMLAVEKGEIKFASAYGILNTLSPECIFEFRKRYPNIVLKYYEYPDAQIDALVFKGEVDFGLAVEPIDEDEFDKFRVCSHQLYLLVNKKNPLSKKTSVEFKDLMHEPFILEGNDFKLYHNFLGKCKEAGFVPNIIFKTSGLSLCHKLVKQNKGISISVDYAIQDIKYENVVAIPFLEHDFLWNICIITKKFQQDFSNIKKTIDFLLEWSNHKGDILKIQ